MSEQERGAAIIQETIRLMRQYGYGWSKAMEIAAELMNQRGMTPQKGT